MERPISLVKLVKRSPLIAGTVAFGATSLDILTNPQTAQAANLCRVQENFRAVTFEDNFDKTGKGRPHIYDGPAIDREIGIATGGVVYAVDKDGNILGSFPVGPDGRGTIKNIVKQCNTKGPNGNDAYEWLTYDDQNPSHKIPAIAENGFGADMVFGRENKKSALTPTPTLTATKTPEITTTPTSRPTPTRTPEAVPGVLPGNPLEAVKDWPWLPISIIAAGALIALGLASRGGHSHTVADENHVHTGGWWPWRRRRQDVAEILVPGQVVRLHTNITPPPAIDIDINITPGTVDIQRRTPGQTT